MQELPTTDQTITYNWTERERVMYSCRATLDRAAFKRWLDARSMKIEEVDGGDVVDYLEENPGASIDERRWPADESEVDIFDLTIVHEAGRSMSDDEIETRFPKP